MPTPPRAVLFDLDGTLADTAPDLAYALNRTLEHYQRPTVPYAAIRPVVSHGAMALIELGFDLPRDDPGFAERRRFLLDVYAANLCRETLLFDGMAEVLSQLEKTSVAWGVVTNKPAWLTDPLITALELTTRAACVVSGDTCSQRKPHPEPILHACALLSTDPTQTWYVGDAGRDMQAGRAAGCTTVGALYGYVHPQDPSEQWQCDLTIAHPEQLLTLLRT